MKSKKKVKSVTVGKCKKKAGMGMMNKRWGKKGEGK